jgi:hypothetical protein
MHLHTED